MLIPGDITSNGELKSAQLVKNILDETKLDMPVYMVNGNHDINNSVARDYSSGSTVPADEDGGDSGKKEDGGDSSDSGSGQEASGDGKDTGRTDDSSSGGNADQGKTDSESSESSTAQ